MAQLANDSTPAATDDGPEVAALAKIERAVVRLVEKTNGHDLDRIRQGLSALIDLGSETALSDLESILGRALDGETDEG